VTSIPPASVPTEETDAALIRRLEDEYRSGFSDYDDALDWRYELSEDNE
jgi:hypothetical protein